MSCGNVRGIKHFLYDMFLMKHFVKRKNTDESIISGKSASLAREVTRTLAFVTSCCTNIVKFEKVTRGVSGYGCWLDVG